MSVSFFYYPLLNYPSGASESTIPMGMLQQAGRIDSERSSDDSQVALHPQDTLALRFQSMSTFYNDQVIGQQLVSTNGSEPVQASSKGQRPRYAVWMRYLVELYSTHPAKDPEVRAPPQQIHYDFFDWATIVKRVSEDVDGAYVPYSTLNGSGYLLRAPDTDTDRYVVVGDIHGGLHTFVRLLLRWHQLNIIDLNSFRVLPPYRLVFLGDILDRGRHAIEIFLTLLLIRYVNRSDVGRFLQCRGNHEHPDMFARTSDDDATHVQLRAKVSQEWNQVLPDIGYTKWENDIMIPALGSLPTALVLSVGGRRYLACHGCVPWSWTQSDNGRLKAFLDDSSAARYLVLSDNETRQFLWNDVSHETSSKVTTNRGGKASGDSVETSNMNTLGRLDLERFAEMNGVSFILRGHQDSCGNAILLTSTTNMSYHVSHTEIQDMTELSDPFFQLPPDARAGLVALLQSDPDMRRSQVGIEVAPLITLSTNTDNRRPLQADSFAMISTLDDVHRLRQEMTVQASILPFLRHHLNS